MKFAILVPTEFEAQLVPDEVKNKDLFMISGILKTTTKNIIRLIEQENVEKVILIGFAGDLKNKNRIGKVLSISSVTNKKETINLKILKGLKVDTASCITVWKPVYSEKIKKELSTHADLVEMECFWAAQACDENNVEFHSLRIISDSCNTSLSDYFSFKKRATPNLLKAQNSLKDTVNYIIKLLS